jgi:hypothetical protein
VLEIPLTFVPDPDTPGAADVKVDVQVAGRTYHCELDTGAGRTTLVADDYLSGLPVAGSEVSAGAHSVSSEELVTIPGLTVGPLSTGPMPVARIAPGARRGSLLGMDVLGRYCLRFRLDRSTLELTSGPAPEATLPLQVDDRGHLYTPASWGDVIASACWDSGAGSTVVDEGFVAAHPELFTPIGTTVGADNSGTTAETPLYLMTGPVIGGAQFAASQVVAVDLGPVNESLQYPMDLIVGPPTYRQANWLFDVPARRWAPPQLLSAG